MKLLIDGYNLVRSVTHKQATRPDIEHMLGRLRRYKRATGHEVTIVFDGGDGMYRYSTGYHGLVIWYSGTQETADDLIKEFIRKAAPESLVLISDDLQLNRVAEECNVISVSPGFFIERMAAREGIATSKKPIHQVVKTSDEDNAELDMLMEKFFSVMPSKNEMQYVDDMLPQQKKSSKLERRLEALIRKL